MIVGSGWFTDKWSFLLKLALVTENAQTVKPSGVSDTELLVCAHE